MRSSGNHLRSVSQEIPPPIISKIAWRLLIYSFIQMPQGPMSWHYQFINTLRPRQNGRHFPDDIFKCISFNENIWISIKISLKGPINKNPALVQRVAWRRPGDKPLSGPVMAIRLWTQICVTRPQWVKSDMINTPFSEILSSKRGADWIRERCRWN